MTKIKEKLAKLKEIDKKKIMRASAIGAMIGVYVYLGTAFVLERSIENIYSHIVYNQPIPTGIDPIVKERVDAMVAGHPIEQMTRHIAKEDPQVAAFLVGIAKKESNWGKRSPKLNGEDCYNYWGFRQKRERMGSGGHTCFDNPKEAVTVVGDRIEKLIEQEHIDSPQKMVVWKCGYSCAGHSPESVTKWIQDVDLYYKPLYN